ncbi:MAG TPA: DUF6111 family protein [Alphaproteobacteria bacterium]|jgi:uncharacterized membrane protein
MLRVFLIYVLPLTVPATLYILWRMWQMKRGSGDAAMDIRAVVRGAPWLLLLGVGTGLLAAVLIVAALTGGEPPHESYAPPHIENGHVVPGETHPDGAAPL